MTDRKTQPEIRPLDQYRLTDPEIYTLPNGIRVVQFDAGTQELVRIELIFRAGSWFQDQNFTSLATNLMLREGTLFHSSQQLSDQLDFCGAHLETTAEKDNAYVTLYTLNKHLPETIPLLEEIVKQASFPAGEFSIFAGKQKQMLQVNMEKVNFMARTRFNPLIYGKSHPYGNYLGVEDIDNFDPAGLSGFHKSHYNAGNCTIMVAGKVDKRLPAMLTEAFGGNDWLDKPAVEYAYEIKPASGSRHFIPRENALQSAIRIGRLLFDRHHADYRGMKVLNTLFGGYFGSRLMANLREDKGYTYGVGSAIIPLQHSGYFFISCEVGSDATADALKQIETEMTKLCLETVPEDELKLVRNYMLGSFLRGIDGPFALADNYRNVMEHGLDNEFLYSMLETIRTISPSQIQQLACKYLNPADMVQLVVGKEIN